MSFPTPSENAARRSKYVRAALLGVAVLVAVPAAAHANAAPHANTVTKEIAAVHADTATATDPVVHKTIATDLQVPWGVAFLPRRETLASERNTARVLSVTPSGKVREVGVVPGVNAAGQGGLMGLAVSPSFARDRYVYAYLTGETDQRIVRMRYTGGRLGAPEPVLTGIPTGTSHLGGRIAFGPDGFLYVGTGDAGTPDSAQDRQSLGGKILRITADGAPAPGNPFPGSPVYSLGHRNVQGFGWDSRGRLWASEFGQATWDELNLITPGANYGWPVVEGQASTPGFVDPLWQWSPAEASPSGLAIADDVIYIAGLRGQRLWRIPLQGEGIGTPAAFLTGEYGRLRTVVRAPGGKLWLTTSNRDQLGTPRPGDDKILSVKP
ncbi:PQQ-dependent sugar dehydrogenase [Planomonospora sp. ID67723]|uniref:PQQ-dependent sugar dehydrogenase n=1 Tax=Planomonospora sp. ID67723 TaxID=2738134 RepID=UPI0018C3FEE4|nr:PQQ-dependent sugar dehydrogenase [Planomonospora sp. ID67723]MBG0829966.1 PQQ-dependent sugar dehydrogenase [Planomonospora sp. ID67723]